MKVKSTGGEPGVPESRRRALILKRYEAIELPTAEDDEAAAAEMGLTVDSLLRLAKAWRLYRNEAMLVGHTEAFEQHGEADRDRVMATTIDLDRVRPDRRAEILRRIRIIQRHIAATEIGKEDVGAAADEMGVSIKRFRVLVRIWMLHARAEALPGATQGGKRWRRKPDHGRRQELLRSALRNARPEASLRSAYDAFAAACRREDLKPLSLKRFYGIANVLRNRSA